MNTPTTDTPIREPCTLDHCDRCGRFEPIAAVRPDEAGTPGAGDALCASCLNWATRAAKVKA